MTKALNTREKLLLHGRRLLWAQGYTSVSLRQIAKAADVDVALISRYFGGKMGLFDTTLAGAFDDPSARAKSTDQLMDLMTQLFVTAPRGGEMPSVVRMILSNAHDDEVGEKVRRLTHDNFYAPLLVIIGCPARTALFMAVLLGISVVEKTIKLPDYPAPSTAAYEARLRHMMQAALSYSGETP
ncbi:TetR/AcrR family transcriptional regulator [Sulfitobacter sp. M368]|uniref:TetR/AcrR family transcriptional regulator n=1 Tax=Sulfitobacter sp. M368 TaxID=2867021 RepID=UPI0021A5DF4B|nr:TetR/AcrR family transcriptional regulator [Sulfitobacter sp. M368]UWR16183.1 TetR family transcriptional regulator [Sulfitobacter sp. M368]